MNQKETCAATEPLSHPTQSQYSATVPVALNPLIATMTHENFRRETVTNKTKDKTPNILPAKTNCHRMHQTTSALSNREQNRFEKKKKKKKKKKHTRNEETKCTQALPSSSLECDSTPLLR
jgi:pyruvate carboxylase